MCPSLDRDRIEGLDPEGIAWPKMDQRELGLSLFEHQLHPSKRRVFGSHRLMGDDHPWGMMIGFDPEGEAERGFATELRLDGFSRFGRVRQIQWKSDRIVAVEFGGVSIHSGFRAIEWELPRGFGRDRVRGGILVFLLSDPIVPCEFELTNLFEDLSMLLSLFR